MTALTRTQSKALGRRTTPTSKSRFLNSLKARAQAQPTINPTDFYSPEIDIARRAAERGYGDTIEDIGIARERGAFDFTRGQQDLNRQRDEGVADIGTQRTRGEQDYSSQIQALQRQYGQQAEAQFGQAGAQGVRRGGTLRQAARKRAENMAIDKNPLDVGRQRLTEDLGTREQRLREAADRGVADLGLDFGRDFGEQGDVTRRERQVRRELPITNYDLDLQNIGAAVQSGFIPPSPVKPAKKRKPKRRR